MEVKQTLDKGNIAYAGSKAASVRKLHRTSAAIVHTGGKHDPVEPRPILACILTTDCSWKPPFGDPFENVIHNRNATDRLDIGCCAGAGAFDELYQDGVTIEVSPKETALAFFFFRLLSKLQQVGTVPAIDYSIYLDALAE